MVDERGRPLLHQHKKCGHLFDPVLVCSECNVPLVAKEVLTLPGPGAAEKPAEPASLERSGEKRKTSRSR